MIVLIYDAPEYIYDKMWVYSITTRCEYVCYDFSGLAIKEPMKLFLQLMENYLKHNIDCAHLYEIKQKEFFSYSAILSYEKGASSISVPVYREVLRL